LWYVERKEGNNWGQPVHLGFHVNSDKDEFFPAVTHSGNLYFTAVRDSGPGSEDIYLSEFKDGRYLEPEPLGPAINSKTYEFNAYVSPWEDLIIFSSYGRPDDLGGGDLYYSTRDPGGQWKSAVHFNLPINTKKLDYCPFFHEPSGKLYYTSNIGRESVKITKPSELVDQVLGVYNSYGNIYCIKYPFTTRR
jgi:hypothetical protein